MKQFFYLLSTTLVLTACIEHVPEVPSDVIPQDTMVLLMTDLRIFESTKQIKSDRNQLDYNIKDAYRFAFDQYNVDEDAFRRSLKFYSQYPKLMEEMYDEVINRISQKQAEHSTKKP